jgi:CHAT domain-containing protein
LANRWVIAGVALLLISFSSVGLYLLAWDTPSDVQIEQLTRSAYNSQRPSNARLWGAAYTPRGESSSKEQDLGKAQILLLRQPDSGARRHAQALIYLAAGEWPKFAELAGWSSLSGNQPDILNNLGVSFLARSEADPTLLLNALDAFERAAKLAPKAPEPIFNLVITYRKLRFQKLAAEYVTRYTALDPNSPWHDEIAKQVRKDESSLLDEMEQAIKANNVPVADRLFQATPELWRRVAMQYALYEVAEPAEVLKFISDQVERRYGDRTVAAMLAPLATDRRDVTLQVRRLVNNGAKLWVDGRYEESLTAYKQAEQLVPQTNSLFDRLWIDLNKVDTQIRVGDMDAVRNTLSRAIALANENGFIWLRAKLQSIYGASFRLSSSYTEMLDLIGKANTDLIGIAAPHDQIRVLYYLSAYRYYGGDQEEALRLALTCLGLVDENDSVRISTLDWLIGSILYRRGMSERSLLFATESVEESQEGPYARGIQLQSLMSLAELYEAMSQPALAEKYLSLAQEAFEKVPPGFDRIKSELLLSAVKAKTSFHQQKYQDAESLLQRNLALYSQQPFPATPVLSQSLMLLAQVYAETGRMIEAGHKFNEAIDVVEKDDDYMKAERFRVKFDDERRELYDSAIEFEFRNGSVDAAWTYLQKYRAKLFLEFLAAFNPDIQPVKARLDRVGVQQRIPKDAQIVEYALLKERLLVWVVTDKLFTVRSIPINRAELEGKVQKVLEKLRTGDNADPLLIDLGKLLIEPVDNLLDPNRTLTIIPDRALHGLPFGALKRPGKSEYLIEDFPIVVSPSLTYFLTGNGAAPPRNEIVGFGSQNGGSSEFKELSALTKIYPKSATFAGQQVDKSSFLAGLKKAAIFHYAGHSATDAVDPLRSSILLDGNRSGPNSVTAVDISEQRLMNNALVILSSCDSSVGNSRDGIGVRGLTSAFLIGGAGSVVGSLWPVEASSTADLMIRFHRAFADSHMPVAKALREAQLAFLKAFPERSHPNYWSGFVVTGNFSAIH